MRNTLAMWCLVIGAACASQAAEAPRGTSTQGAESKQRSDPGPLPAAYDATFTQAVPIPLGLLEASINARLTEYETRERALLTRPNASPAIDASFEVWRDAVKVSFDTDTLHIDVPLRYAARFGARIKNPFGGKWLTLTRDADWGTAAEPQRMTLRVHTRVVVTPSWELQLSTEIEPPQHGPAPQGELCTSGSFKLCTPAESLAPEVRRRIDAEIVPRIREELEKLDRDIEGKVALRARTERIWQQLSQPRPLAAAGRYSALAPREAALELTGQGDMIVVQAAVSGQVSFHEGEPAPIASPPLPDRRPLAELPGERKQDSSVFAIDPML
jgi:hypothetical protein